MGWKPWDLARLDHPRDFVEAVQGYQWQLARQLDCAVFVAHHVLNAAGVTKSDAHGGGHFTMQELIGRELFAPLVPEAPETDAQREQRELDEAERFAKQERAKFQIWAAQKAKAARERGEDPGPLTHG